MFEGKTQGIEFKSIFSYTNSSYALMLTLLNVIYFLCWEGEGGAGVEGMLHIS